MGSYSILMVSPSPNMKQSHLPFTLASELENTLPLLCMIYAPWFKLLQFHPLKFLLTALSSELIPSQVLPKEKELRSLIDQRYGYVDWSFIYQLPKQQVHPYSYAFFTVCSVTFMPKFFSLALQDRISLI